MPGGPDPDNCRARSEADLHGTKAAHGLLSDDRFREQAGYVLSLEPFRDLAPGKIVEFLFRIGRELVSTRPQAFSLEQPGELAWKAHIALNRGLELSERWPAAFHEIASAFVVEIC